MHSEGQTNLSQLSAGLMDDSPNPAIVCSNVPTLVTTAKSPGRTMQSVTVMAIRRPPVHLAGGNAHFLMFVFSVCLRACDVRTEQSACVSLCMCVCVRARVKISNRGPGSVALGVGPIKRECFSSSYPEGRSGFNKAGSGECVTEGNQTMTACR